MPIFSILHGPTYLESSVAMATAMTAAEALSWSVEKREPWWRFWLYDPS